MGATPCHVGIWRGIYALALWRHARSAMQILGNYITLVVAYTHWVSLQKSTTPLLATSFTFFCYYSREDCSMWGSLPVCHWPYNRLGELGER